MLLIEARRTARVSASGELVTLNEQDRGAWDAAMVAEGHRLVRERLAAGVAPGRYQILAAINAVHTSARHVRNTDWSQVVALYDHLVRLDPSPIIALNRAIAIAELDGPEVALAAVDRLEGQLVGYHAYHATRADLLRRLGCIQQSRAAYDKAIELAGNSAETAYLTRRRDPLRQARLHWSRLIGVDDGVTQGDGGRERWCQVVEEGHPIDIGIVKHMGRDPCSDACGQRNQHQQARTLREVLGLPVECAFTAGLIFVVACLVAIGGAFFDPARAAAGSEMLPPDHHTTDLRPARRAQACLCPLGNRFPAGVRSRAGTRRMGSRPGPSPACSAVGITLSSGT